MSGRSLLHMAPHSFDASLFEIWAALLNGGCSAIAPENLSFPGELGEVLRKHQCLDSLAHRIAVPSDRRSRPAGVGERTTIADQAEKHSPSRTSAVLCNISKARA